jgi:hypothetical protein
MGEAENRVSALTCEVGGSIKPGVQRGFASKPQVVVNSALTCEAGISIEPGVQRGFASKPQVGAVQSTEPAKRALGRADTNLYLLAKPRCTPDSVWSLIIRLPP